MTRKVLKVPYKSQRDNVNRPSGTCNVTSLAMCLEFKGIVGDGNGQLEDQLFRYARSQGWNVTEPQTLVRLATWKGIRNRFTTRGSLQTIYDAIDAGDPLVAHGWFTRPSGHIVAVIGYDKAKQTVICHDPWGDWSPSGYILNDPSVPVSHPAARKGEAVEFRVTTWMNLVSPEGSDYMWLHRISR